MTFKHDLSSSEVLRSLQKVAQQKGLLKPEPLHKTAAPKSTTNLVPSDSLLDNVLKLCTGLRQRGFTKQAEDLEANLSSYKKAQTLYQTTPEKGEDVIEFAHPEGSHQLEGIDAKNDGAVFEDILDRMAKTLQVIEKKPTGKLTEAQQAIKSVKQVMGASFLAKKAGAGNIELPMPVSSGGGWSKLLGMLGRAGAAEVGGSASATGIGALAPLGAFTAAIAIGAIGGAIYGNHLFDFYLAPDEIGKAGQNLIDITTKSLTYYSGDDAKFSVPIQKALADLEASFDDVKKNYSAITNVRSNPSLDSLSMLKQLDDAIWTSNKAAQSIWSWTQAFKDEAWYRKSPIFNIYESVVALAANYMNRSRNISALIDKFVSDANANLQVKLQQQSVAQGGSATQQLLQRYTDLLAQIDSMEAIIKANRPQDQAAQIAYLEGAKKYITGERDEFKALDPKTKDSVITPYSNRLNDAVSKIEAFKTKKLA